LAEEVAFAAIAKPWGAAARLLRTMMRMLNSQQLFLEVASTQALVGATEFPTRSSAPKHQKRRATAINAIA
jgi:hypothetical protein